MGTQIRGTEFVYEIDEQDFPGGFIASGTESFVFKGRKISIGTDGKSDLSFSCVLKFKPKTEARLHRFKEKEVKIFEELQECRSVARIYDIVEDIGDDFELGIPGSKSYIRNSNSTNIDGIVPCFCVVEEFIDGWSLEQYCRREFWKLEVYEKNRWVKYEELTDLDKDTIMKKYRDEKFFFRYQDKMLHFMQSLCDILEYISTLSEKKVLHLDIKPENIMVTRQSEELVLIDFGRSVFLSDGCDFVMHDMQDVDYNERENINSLYSHGTIGYAAPECFAHERNGSKFPFSKSEHELGKMSIQSDIFSFGATFWECLNIVELVTRSSVFSMSPHDFYEKYLLNDEAYFTRDLSLENTGPLGGRYHEGIEKIIRKCTNLRSKDHFSSDKYYHNYEELRRDIVDARESIPTVKKDENKQVKNASVALGICIGCILVLLTVAYTYKFNGYNIATKEWNDVISTYQITQFSKVSDLAEKRFELANGRQKKEVCKDAFEFISTDRDVTSSEAAFMVSLLGKMTGDDDTIKYIDKIMEYANVAEVSTISSHIASLDLSTEDMGYNLAVCIYGQNNITGFDYDEAYKLLGSYKKYPQYGNAMKHLAASLNNKGDRVINVIAEKTGEARADIVRFLDEVEENT